MLAANVDVAFLVGALDAGRGFNLPRLERALALVRASGAEAVAVLNKADLCDDIAARVREAQSAATDVPILVGGLVRSQNDVTQAVANGACAVSTSRRDLWDMG